MLRKYFDKRKHKMLPWVTDWTDPHNHLRYAADVSKLTYDEWFWFNPINHKIVTYSPPIIMSMVFGSASSVMFYFGWGIGAVFFAVCTIIMLRDFWNKWKQREMTKDTNMYDVFMREWVMGEKVK